MYTMKKNVSFIKIKKILLTEVRGEYKNMYIRPYEMKFNFGDINLISKLVKNFMGSKYNYVEAVKSMLSNNELNIMQPASKVMCEAPIDGGWGEKRFKVDVIIELFMDNDNIKIINHIQGYTSHLCKSQSNYIDMDMNIYINSITSFRVINNILNGKEKHVNISNDAVAFDETGYNKTLDNNNALRVSRPDDVANRISTLDDMYSEEVYISNINTINELQIINKECVTPLDYTASFISTTIDSVNLCGSFYTDPNDIMDNIIGGLLTQIPENLDFYKILLSLGVNDLSNLTFKDLLLIDSEAPEIEFKNQSDNIYANKVFNIDRNTLANLNDDKTETISSLLIEIILSKLMSKNFIDEIAFTIDNKSGKPEYNLKMIKSIFYKNEDLTCIGNKLLSSFIKELWNNLSADNKHLLIIDVCNIGTEVVIKINLDKNKELVYLYPTFADSKYLPIITKSDGIEEIANVFYEIIGIVTDTIEYNQSEMKFD